MATPQPFATLSAAMDSPCSEFFGVGPKGARDPHTLYSTSREIENLTFDVSNNQVLCSFTAAGLAQHACVVQSLAAGELGGAFRGAYVTKEITAGGPWPLGIEIAGRPAVTLHSLPSVQADLVANLLPMFTYRTGGMRIRVLAFAPIDIARPELSPRAIVLAVEIYNEGSAAVQGRLRSTGVPTGQVSPVSSTGILPVEGSGMHGRDAHATQQEHGRDAHATHGQEARATEAQAAFSLAGGAVQCLAFTCAIGADADETRAIQTRVAARPALDWINDTLAYHTRRLGTLSIPGDPYWAESLVRASELCRQSELHLPDGRFGGSFWGSRFCGPASWENKFIWIKDIYHAMLPMGMLHPQLCAGAAAWFNQWGPPPQAFGRGLARWPDASPATHSPCNALAAYLLAGEYYRNTGDAAFFGGQADPLAGAIKMLGQIHASRRGEEMLFPALYISDGDARGDWHTGSNVVIWKAFAEMSRLANEVYDVPDLAAAWASNAEELKAAILAHCAGASPHGRRFFEGANADGTFVAGHDGEETDTTLMPFYGFCEADEPALLTHARVAMTSENPLYWPEMDGVWWTDDKHYGATFPAWMTSLASAADEAELARQLLRIRRLTDLDGSIWWWPYLAGATDPNAPQRAAAAMKCAWAAGVFACLFIHNILGLRADRPARRVSFRPFCPWPEFSWQNCRLGESCFDVTYRNDGQELSATLTNRNAEPYEAIIELMLPPGADFAPEGPEKAGTVPVLSGRRFNRETLIRSGVVNPGETLELRCL
ncbi:MAG: glycoside hydrolase family 15 protein [Planctomycetaceae bacterium]|nr:glycoside hydrolase family 15 protein [Planctomycetaceae bacterium]